MGLGENTALASRLMYKIFKLPLVLWLRHCKEGWIGYYQWVSKTKYRRHCSKAKRTVHKTQKLWESIGETENKEMEKSERSRETEDNAGLGWNFDF